MRMKISAVGTLRRGERGFMEIVNNERLLRHYLEEFHIPEYFGESQPRFSLLRYAPGELLTNPFAPSSYLQFIVKGDLMLYDMPNEDSTVALQTSFLNIRIIGEMELLDMEFMPFFVEARSEVYTCAIYLEQYREQLLENSTFLLYICRSLAAKLKTATDVSVHVGLKERMAAYIRRMGKGAAITNIGHLAKQLNVSERQMIRILKAFCEKGVLCHEKNGLYRVLLLPQEDEE